MTPDLLKAERVDSGYGVCWRGRHAVITNGATHTVHAEVVVGDRDLVLYVEPLVTDELHEGPDQGRPEARRVLVHRRRRLHRQRDLDQCRGRRVRARPRPRRRPRRRPGLAANLDADLRHYLGMTLPPDESLAP